MVIVFSEQEELAYRMDEKLSHSWVLFLLESAKRLGLALLLLLLFSRYQLIIDILLLLQLTVFTLQSNSSVLP